METKNLQFAVPLVSGTCLDRCRSVDLPIDTMTNCLRLWGGRNILRHSVHSFLTTYPPELGRRGSPDRRRGSRAACSRGSPNQQTPSLAAPATAANHAVRPACHERVGPAGEFRLIIVAAPLLHIAVHIVKAPRVRFLLTDPMRMPLRFASITLDPPHQA